MHKPVVYQQWELFAFSILLVINCSHSALLLIVQELTEAIFACCCWISSRIWGCPAAYFNALFTFTVMLQQCFSSILAYRCWCMSLFLNLCRSQHHCYFCMAHCVSNGALRPSLLSTKTAIYTEEYLAPSFIFSVEKTRSAVVLQFLSLERSHIGSTISVLTWKVQGFDYWWESVNSYWSLVCSKMYTTWNVWTTTYYILSIAIFSVGEKHKVCSQAYGVKS